MAKAEYKSSIRSKNQIKHAYVALLHEKDVSKITVADIIKLANVSRGTFYAHYPDVKGVLARIEREEIIYILSSVRELGIVTIMLRPSVCINKFCEVISRDPEYYKMLILSESANGFLSRLMDRFREKMLKELLNHEEVKISQQEAAIYLCFISNAIRSVLIAWLKGDIDATQQELDRISSKLIDACSETMFANITE